MIWSYTNEVPLLLMGFKLMAGAVASCALIGVAVVPYSRKLKVVGMDG